MTCRKVEKVIQTDNYEITIHEGDINGFHGCFEHDELGDESAGELWFDPMGELLDYDGVFELPKEVATALKHAGHYGEML